MINVEPVSTRSLPLNFGPLRGFNGHARIEGDCGDTMEFWMEVDDGIVRRASFTTDGCQTSIACGSMAARLAEGRALRDLKRSRPLEVLEALGQGDNAEAHPCADLALRTLARAAADYEEAVRPRRDPSQCPDDADCGRCGETCEHPKPQAQAAPLSQEGPASIRKRLLVLSGKGGVGKSTVAVNLAMGFAFQGLRTGLLDVDIHGPSVPKLLGLEKQTLQSEGGEILPVEVGGLKVMSMGFILKAGEPAIWRGPMKAGAISQLIRQVQWQDLDVLVVDCPPGTGDEHFQTAGGSRSGVFGQQMRRPMRGNNARLMGDAELGKRLRCIGHGGPIRLAAHDDADQRFFVHLFIIDLARIPTVHQSQGTAFRDASCPSQIASKQENLAPRRPSELNSNS